MIKLVKKMVYYNKKQVFDTCKIETIEFTTLKEAKKYFDNYKIKSIINLKNISMIEEISFIYKKDYNIFEKYTKTIDLSTGNVVISTPKDV